MKPESGAQMMAGESASGVPLELIGLLTPLPADAGPVPGEIVEDAFGTIAVPAFRVTTKPAG